MLGINGWIVEEYYGGGKKNQFITVIKMYFSATSGRWLFIVLAITFFMPETTLFNMIFFISDMG